MVPILSVIAAILLHGIAQSGVVPGADVQSWQALLVAALVLAIPYGIGRRARRAAIRGDLRRGARLQRLTEHSGWIAFGVLLFAGGWVESVRHWTGATLDLDGWPEGALGLSFLPYVVYQLAAVDASVRAAGGSQLTQRHLRAFQSRMFFACLAPIVVFLGASVLLGSSDWLRAQVEHVGLASVLFTGVMVLVLAQLLPLLLRWSWNTAAFPEGPQRDRLEEVAKAAQFQPRDVRVWRTGDLMANAAIVGFTPKGRTVLFSDQLLSLLNTRELCAVYAHEIGHARRGHVAVFLCWTLGFVFLGDFAARRAIDAYGIWIGCGVGVAALGMWFFSFGWLSRRFELDADLFSLQTVQDLPALVSALERVGGSDREASGWRHFGVGPRVRFLAKAVENGAFVKRFRGRLRMLAALGALLAVSGAALQLFDLFTSLPRERAIAALATGDYEEATGLAADLGGTDADEIRELAAAATRIGAGSDRSSRPALISALNSALDRADTAEARSLATLAALRGVANAADLAEALDEMIEGGAAEGLASKLEHLRQTWRGRTATGS